MAKTSLNCQSKPLLCRRAPNMRSSMCSRRRISRCFLRAASIRRWKNSLSMSKFIPLLLAIQVYYFIVSGPGSSVGIATGYGMDGPGIESRWGRDFPHLSRPALGPSLLYNGYRVFSGVESGPGRDADLSPPSSDEV
jgi:hypothetical protein